MRGGCVVGGYDWGWVERMTVKGGMVSEVGVEWGEVMEMCKMKK